MIVKSEETKKNILPWANHNRTRHLTAPVTTASNDQWSFSKMKIIKSHLSDLTRQMDD